MFRKPVLIAIAAAGLGLAGTAQADTAVNATVTARDAAGHATQVSVDGQDYTVCRGDVQDSCINPRQAGLNFGNVPLDYWPGQPASELPDGALPATPM